MAGVNTPLFRSQIRPLRGVFHGESYFGSPFVWHLPKQKAPGGSRGTPGQNPIPCAMHNPGSPKNPVSPDFRPGLLYKRGGPFFTERQTNASAVSAGAGPYFRGAIVKLARPWLTLRTAAE